MERRHEVTEVDRWVDERMASLGGPGDWVPDLTAGIERLRQRQNLAVRTMRTWVWAAAGSALAAGCLMAFPTTRAFASRCVDACGQLVTRVSTTQREAAGRKPAPDFTLNDAAGHPVSLSSLRGKTVLLNFWATWCKPCAAEIPWFVEFERDYRERGLVVLGVSLDEDGWAAVRPFIEARQVNYRMVVGGNAVAALFGGIESLPSTLIVDRQGRIAATHVGLVSKSVYEDGIKAVLAE